MVDGINAATSGAADAGRIDLTRKILPKDLRVPERKNDILSLGQGGKVSSGQALNIVTERAYEKLRAVVDDARAALGLPEGAEIDTSPDATANRIADFALGYFSKYAENNGLANDEAGRKQFVDFIGAAVTKGIDEARGILGSLQALDDNISSNIDQTASIIQDRFQQFIEKGV
ncbi:MAG: hypothetical protein GC168_02060 [Candidatus Hydrogenedens sp.]|nr:hypothetical protein [Candidatus Hydrogenedens sp.]